MISRRNIRVKVLQSLYALESESGNMPDTKVQNLLKKYLDQTTELFTFTVFLLTEVARYSETDAKNRASKHLPSQEDLSVNTKIAGNDLLWQILELPGFTSQVEHFSLQQHLDKDFVKKIYLNLVDSEEYPSYINTEGRDKKSEKNIMSFIFTDLIMANENVTDYIEELYPHWDDDSEMVYQMVLNLLAKPNSYDFNRIISKEKNDYAFDLLKTVIGKKDYTMELITPKLKNWDPERIAVLDMLMLRMGICELLYFETIPTKVTINEYIDIAKSYSTNQSGHFINGILDNIHKDLLEKGTIKKVDFKKK